MSTPAILTAPVLTFLPTPVLTPVYHICNTMAGVTETTPDPSVPGFPEIFASRRRGGAHITLRSRLNIFATLPLGERPPLVVYLDNPEPHIRVLWSAQFGTPSFAQPKPEDGKVLAFARDIRLGLLPATVVVNPE